MTDQGIDFSQELKQFPIFQGLSDADLRAIAVTKPPAIRRGVTLFRQGNAISRVFLIVRGEVDLVHRDAQDQEILRRTVRQGEVLGRLELDTPEGQLGTATTRSLTEVLYIDKDVLVSLRSRFPSLRNHLDRSEVIGHLRATPYFAPLSDLEIKWISDIITIEEVEKGRYLYAQGDQAEDVYVIRQGRVRIDGLQAEDRRWVSAGSVVGDRSAILDRRRMSTVVVESRCKLYRLPAEDFRYVADLHPQHNWLQEPINVERLLRNTALFANLDADNIRRLAGYTMKVHYHRPHYTIVRQYSPDDYYYVLVHGGATQFVVREDGGSDITLLDEGSAFGEESVLLGEQAQCTVETVTPTNWLRIHRTDLKLFMTDQPDVKRQLDISEPIAVRLLGEKMVGSWQEEGEYILLYTRRHWVVLARNIAAVLGVALLFGLCGFGVTMAFPILFWLMTLLFFLLTLPAAAWIFLDYLNDHHIVTSKRIAHEEKIILISEKRTSAPLDKVQDIKVDRGFWAQVFGYGHVVISTAAEEGQILFDFLPDADTVQAMISVEASKAKAGVRSGNEETIRRQLQDRLHMGLEEKLDERALIETPPLRAGRRAPQRRYPILEYLGLRQAPDNKLIWRKHWLGLLISTFAPLMLTSISALFLALSFIAMFGDASGLVAIIAAISLVIGVGWLWWDWTDWRNDLYIVSDQHIEHIEKKPLIFDERRTVTSLERVQNVEFTKPNPIAYLLNFGNVYIQTAATEGLVTFRYVPQPDQVQIDIYDRIERYQETMDQMRQKQFKTEMGDWLEAYHKLLVEERDRNPGQA